MPIRLAFLVLFVLLFGAIGDGRAVAGGDAGKGEELFRTCGACHQIGAGARNSTGPVLNNIVGRKAATRDGYKYSSAMAEAGADGLVWTADALDAYVASPRAFVRGTRMAYAGLPNETARADLIAFLATLQFDQPAQSKILK
jgi:cytochrome c